MKRIYVEKRQNFAVEAKQLYNDIIQNLQIKELMNVRIINRYDVSGINHETYELAKNTIFSEPPVDFLYEEEFPEEEDEFIFAVEYLPGQYDQQADSAQQCIQILDQEAAPIVRSAKVIILKGSFSEEQLDSIKKYCINPVDSREASLEKPETLELDYEIPGAVEKIEEFINLEGKEINDLRESLGLAMSKEDLFFVQRYFKDVEKRDPTITEIRVLDTYWSDHCRHTTFLTKINNVQIERNGFTEPVKKAFQYYQDARKEVYGIKQEDKNISLMDIALMGMKELRKQGAIQDLEVSDEINACSIVVPVDIRGKEEEWLVMFKNETHNHPTEIEPFGGAATCLGGAIRDPLSGRSYVYQAMRITGSGDVRQKIEETLPGKLPQRKIGKESAHGYSSYGNQIGLATGQVTEIYDEKFLAKHMELGAVIAAAPRENVIRGKAEEGDMIILLGGQTGRDGCGGATGSSKEHTEESIHSCGAEVQKGNAPTERKIQRLFRNPEVSRMIKKCNDFGAGGVSVAIGELADGLVIDLDAVPKKYAGLDGTELSISESQERMAVVVEKKDVHRFITLAEEENLEAAEVAVVTNDRRLVMKWKGQNIVDVGRDFLDTNGATQVTDVKVTAPKEKDNYFKAGYKKRVLGSTIKEKWLENIADLNICSQKGLVEMFDSSIGGGTVLMPYGGKNQSTPPQCMVAKIPLEKGETTTGTMMSYGYNPKLSTWSPFHGAIYAVVESVSKIVASGGQWDTIRFTFQEYFERLNEEAVRWGKPFSALLGAYYAQKELGLPSIGGKDSMSGTFHDIDVPPTLVSFAVNVVNVKHVISPEFKNIGNPVVYIPLNRDQYELPDFSDLKKNYTKLNELIQKGFVLSAQAITLGGAAEALSKMTFGNDIGIHLEEGLTEELFYAPNYGSIVIEIAKNANLQEILEGIEYKIIGRTTEEKTIDLPNEEPLEIKEIYKHWESTLENVYPTKAVESDDKIEFEMYSAPSMYINKNKVAKPKVFIPVFPGTNCEYDTAKQFELAGAAVETFVFKNLRSVNIQESIEYMRKAIMNSQIIMLSGGFSAGDEPDGSGKFIATVFRNPMMQEAVMDLLQNRDGLMLGICNGFQALIKLGLVPYGQIQEIKGTSPTLTYNTIGRHVSCMVQTKIVSNKSPWFTNVKVGDIHTIPVSHGEGRFVADGDILKRLFSNGQVATQYVDPEGNPTYHMPYNPNGSAAAIEGITSPDGRVLGKMGHSERIGMNVAKNISGNQNQKIFCSGVEYFTK